jgi:hypothetical protein
MKEKYTYSYEKANCCWSQYLTGITDTKSSMAVTEVLNNVLLVHRSSIPLSGLVANGNTAKLSLRKVLPVGVGEN